MKKFIPITLIIFGILLISIPSSLEYMYKLKQNKNKIEPINSIELSNNSSIDLDSYYSDNKDFLDEDILDPDLDDFSFDGIEDVSIEDIFSLKSNDDDIIGHLYIPSININLPIYKTLNNTNLMLGAVPMKSKQIMGMGNYTLAGHYMKNKDLLFGNLMNIEIGDLAYLVSDDKIFEYTVMENLIVKDTRLDMLNDNRADNYGGPIVSIMTCYYTSKSQKRFFSIGKLTNIYYK